MTLKAYGADLDAVYGAIYIVINPVRAGPGLKIKSVEALGYGLPLVATSEGACRLPESDRPFLMVADDAAFRAELAQSAYDYAQRQFTTEA